MCVENRCWEKFVDACGLLDGMCILCVVQIESLVIRIPWRETVVIAVVGTLISSRYWSMTPERALVLAAPVVVVVDMIWSQIPQNVYLSVP